MIKTKTQQKESISSINAREKFLEIQRQRLLDLRHHLQNRMNSSALEVIKSSGNRENVATFGMHTADAGSDSYDCDFALSILSQETDSLKEINDALERIEKDEYGFCVDSGEEIPADRLEALPFARRTVECQAKFEKNSERRQVQRASLMKIFEDTDDEDYELT